jgi:hypothetical protein
MFRFAQHDSEFGLIPDYEHPFSEQDIHRKYSVGSNAINPPIGVADKSRLLS